MTAFIQIIEFTTTRMDEIEALGDEMQASDDVGTVRRLTITADRDRPNHYLNVVEFESYDAAVEDSERPDTSTFVQRMTELCDEPPVFHDLDVLLTWPA